MGKTKFQRVASFFLAVLLLLGCGTLAVGAEDSQTGIGSTVTDKTISDYKEELGSISYENYTAGFAGYAQATETVVFNAIDSLNEELTNLDWLTEEQWNSVKNSTGAPAYKGIYAAEFDGVKALYTPGDGSVCFTKSGVPEGLYSIRIRYYSVTGKAASIEREFYINGKAPFKEARSLTMTKTWVNAYKKGEIKVGAKQNADELVSKATGLGIKAVKEDRDGATYIVYDIPDVWTQEIADYLIHEIKVRFLTTDLENNELRPTAQQVPTWNTYEICNSEGYSAESYVFIVEPDANGNVTLTLKGVNEPMAIEKIELIPHTTPVTYADYIAQYKDAPKGTSAIKLEAELTSTTSTNTVYPVEDRASAASSPADTTRTVLNTIGGEKWQTAGQWVTYKFKVGSTGLYTIDARFKQDVLDGLFTSRALSLYSEGIAEGQKGYYNGYPFIEAAGCRFNYSGYWQSSGMNNGATDENGNLINYEFYFVEGVTYTVKLEVTLGTMADILGEIEDILNCINTDYLTIIRLTGTSPDSYRDYNFTRVMPSTLADMVKQSTRLDKVSARLIEIAGSSSSTVATLVKVSKLLFKMHDEDEIAKNLETLKSYVGSLGTFLTDAKTQPLCLDYLMVQNPDNKVPTAEPNFWKKMIHEISSFIQSFKRDYNSMGTMIETDGNSLEVWMATGRDQAQVIRNETTNDFTYNSGTGVDLKLVAGGTLLPSILAGMGPDVYLGLDQGSVINYAIRGALETLDEKADGSIRSDFTDVTKSFTDAAMLVLGIENAEGDMHYYGLPETQSFPMLFIRIDILANLNIEIPTTWDEIYEAQNVLEGNNMAIGLSTDYKVFLYQNDGDLFADEGMRINLDSQVGLDSFKTMCQLFTMKSFPYSYNAANRFRTGEMPILIADYVGMYNQLKVFATEIEGLWKFIPVPGIKNPQTGVINNCAISGVGADVMIKGTDQEDSAWEYLKWFTGASAQTTYANDMVSIIGDSAKHATANREALASMPWTTEEFTEVSKQFENLAAVPNYPGSYYIDRYTGFAFLAAYNNGQEPVSELLSYINTINNEITRKRKEFLLETLEIGQTLADKREAQAMEALNLLAEKDESYKSILETVRIGSDDADMIMLTEAANELNAKLNTADAASYTVKVNRQDQESKNGGYRISSLSTEQLIYFAATCLTDAVAALRTY